MAEDIRELVLRLLLQIPDAKVPALDTKEAEAALERLREKGRRVQQELEGVGRAAAGGGAVMPVFQPGRPPTYQPWQPGGIPMPATPPGGLFVNPNQYPAPIGPLPRPYGPWGAGATPIYGNGAATLLSGPWNADFTRTHDGKWGGSVYTDPGGRATGSAYGYGPGQINYGGPAYGPISDPGSHATASPNARSGPMRDFVGQVHTLERYDQGVQKLTASLRNFREASISAAAGMLMFEHGMESGSVVQMGLGGVMMGDSALRIGQSVPNMVRMGAGRVAGMAASGMRMVGPGMLGGALGGLGAGAGWASGLSGAAIAGGAAIGGLALANLNAYGRLAFGGELGTDAVSRWIAGSSGIEAAGLGLDQQLLAARQRGIDIADFSQLAGYGSRTMQAGRLMSADALRFQAGGMSFGDLSAATMGRVGAIGLDSNRLGGLMSGFAAGGENEKAAAAGEQIVRNMQTQLQLLQQLQQLRRQDLQTQLEKVNVAQRETEATKEAADNAAGRVGGVRTSQWNRGRRLYERAMADGTIDAREVDQLTRAGFGDARDVVAARRRIGQGRTDAANAGGYAGLLPEESRTSEEMRKLEAKIKQLETSRKVVTDSIARTFEADARAMDALNRRVEVAERRINDLAIRTANSGGR